MKAFALIAYLLLQIAFIPLAVIGIALTGYKQIASASVSASPKPL